jgi:hypothetical protein
VKKNTPSRNAATAAIEADVRLARTELAHGRAHMARVLRGLRRLAAADAVSQARAAERLAVRSNMAVALIERAPMTERGLATALSWRTGTAHDVLHELRRRGLIRLRADSAWCLVARDSRDDINERIDR